MKIQNAIETFFTDKEHYNTFVSNWKSFIANGNHKKYKITHDYYNYFFVGDLNCVHHLIYAALRGKDVSKNFTKNTKVPTHLAYEAYSDAVNLIRAATINPRQMDKIVKVFGSSVTVDMLGKLYTQLQSIDVSK